MQDPLISNDKIEIIYQHFKNGNDKHYNEERHCKMLLKIMMHPDKGTVGAFCVEAFIDDKTFYKWVNKHPLFSDIYCYSKLVARQEWEREGRAIRDEEFPMGVVNYKFEHWKMIGWSRFGIGKNSRIKLNLNPNDSPLQHYQQVLRQASQGEFTASEIKQLMEAVNVGLNTHEKLELQKQIDELKADLALMQANQNVQNPFANKGTAQKD